MGDDLAFDPRRIEATAGEPLRLAIDNEGKALHDFTIEEIEVDGVSASGGADSGGHGSDGHDTGLHLALEGGRSGTLEFTPLKPGEYEFTCTEPGHAENGMTGTLVVTE